MPHGTERAVINTILYVLITGCRWCDVPRGSIWASIRSAHRWLQQWKADGTLFEIQSQILGLAQELGLIDWDFGAVDGSVSNGKRGGEKVAHGYKGKGILIHTLTDANGMPLANRTTAANGNEKAQVIPLLDDIAPKTGKIGRPRKRPRVLAGDKGYDSSVLRDLIRRCGIRP